MRRACVAGNWKMNKSVQDSISLVKELMSGLDSIENVDSIICPPFIALATVSDLVKKSKIALGAQNHYWEEKGAFTGEVSSGMVAEIAEYVILGHSERRAYFQDTDEAVNKKVLAALKVGLKPILCVGETLDENESGKTGEVVKRQLTNALTNVSIEDFGNIMIAYEPVWAIGTGKAATAEGANQVIKEFIRDEVSSLYSPEAADKVRILYGGSVKPENAKEYFQQPDIDGALVGGASLKADAFIEITRAAA